MADVERPNYYAILGVGREATPEDLKKAYRKIAFECHPDRNPGDSPEAVAAVQRFKEASEAYQILSDPDRRAKYDRGDDVVFLGASAAREVARRSVQRIILDCLRNRGKPIQGGVTP
jgi:curved DNA-binding protein CbpA